MSSSSSASSNCCILSLQQASKAAALAWKGGGGWQHTHARDCACKNSNRCFWNELWILNPRMRLNAVTLTLLSSASRLKFISAILSNVALRKENANVNGDKRMSWTGFLLTWTCVVLLDVFIVLAELLVVEPKLIHKVSGHLLDLVIGEGLKSGVGRRLSSTLRWGQTCDNAVASVFPTCWRDRSLGKGLSMSSSSLEECMLWVLTCGTWTTVSFVTSAFSSPSLILKWPISEMMQKHGENGS